MCLREKNNNSLSTRINYSDSKSRFVWSYCCHLSDGMRKDGWSFTNDILGYYAAMLKLQFEELIGNIA